MKYNKDHEQIFYFKGGLLLLFFCDCFYIIFITFLFSCMILFCVSLESIWHKVGQSTQALTILESCFFLAQGKNLQ